MLSDSIVGDNIAGAFGGGISVFDGNTSISRSSVIDNTAGLLGGGLQISTGIATITDSTVSRNSSAGRGGGIRLSAASLDLINSTVSENSAGAFLGDGGGGINAGAEPVRIINSTIAGNSTVAGQGGGVDVFSAPLTIENSIVADNTAGDVSSDVQRTQTENPLTINHSLIGNADGLGTIDGNVGNLTGTEANPLDPQLGELADNGGPTLTHALLPGSPAIDAGDNALAVDADGNPLAFDQRGEGFSRISVGVVDMGAFEADESPSLTVTTDLDIVDSRDGLTSLREAIAFADSLPGEDTVTFDSSLAGETILLNGTELQIGDSLIIDASALSSSVTVDAGGQSRVMNFIASSGDLGINNLTITGGVTSGRDDGAGIFFNAAGTLTVTNSVIRGNSSANNSGGIEVRDGDLVLSQSDVIGNTAQEFGGGVLVFRGNATITASNITGNEAIEEFGGGLHLERGLSTITDSTVSQNSSGRGGGGINAPFSSLTLLNSTVSENSTGSFGGGGILRGLGDNPLVIINSTIVRNTSDADQGGGIEVRDAPVTIQNSIVAENTAGDIPADFLRDGGQGTLTINQSLIGNADGLGTIDGKRWQLDRNGSRTA